MIEFLSETFVDLYLTDPSDMTIDARELLSRLSAAIRPVRE
jgi:hypothetical protein